jgi:hypothetical protein
LEEPQNVTVNEGEDAIFTCRPLNDPTATVKWVKRNQTVLSPGTPVSSTIKSDSHDITEILLKVAFNTIFTCRPLNDPTATVKWVKRNQTGLQTSIGTTSDVSLVTYLGRLKGVRVMVLNATFNNISVIS